MKLPLHIDGVTVRDAEGRVIISALNPINIEERELIINYVNATMKRKRKNMGETERMIEEYAKSDPFRDLARRTIPCVKAAVKYWKHIIQVRGPDATVDGQIRQANKLYETLDYIIREGGAK